MLTCEFVGSQLHHIT